MILHLPPGSPPALQAAAAVVLALHISGGVVGIAAGGGALVLRKGSRLHSAAGKVFLVSMLVMAIIGAAVSPFLPQRANVVMGMFVTYLVLTGWLAIRRREASNTTVDLSLTLLGMAAAMTGLVFGFQAMSAPGGLLDGGPPWSYWVLASLPAIAIAGDLNVFLKSGISRGRRLARHLWRMGAALLIATASLFLGQEQVFPQPLRGSFLLYLPVAAVLLMTIGWLMRVVHVDRSADAPRGRARVRHASYRPT